MMREAPRRALVSALAGAAAGAVGTMAMDLVEFRRYRRGGGTDRLIPWETAQGVSKWESASAKYRRAIAQALASATMAMLTGDPSMPESQVLRSALVNWGFNTKQRSMAPGELGDALICLGATPRKSRSWQIRP